jgi:hypothetical protein
MTPARDPRTGNEDHPELKLRLRGVVAADGRFIFPSVEGVPADIHAAMTAACASWRFSPGLRSGEPVDTAVAVPVVFPPVFNAIHEIDEVDQPPVVEKSAPLPAKEVMVEIALAGGAPAGTRLEGIGSLDGELVTGLSADVGRTFQDEAVVRYVVEKDGTVSGIEVVSSYRPEFVPIVEDTISKYRFKPGMHHGVPVRVRMTQRMGYTFAKHP